MIDNCRMKIANAVLITLALPLLFGCGPKDVKKIRPLEIAEKVTDLTSRIANIRLIRLEEGDESMLTYPTKMFILSDESIVLKDSGGKILRFDSQGNYLGRIGARGRGHGEYTKLQDICIEPVTENVCVLDIGQILRYDVREGTFIDRIEIPRHNYDEFCSDRNGGFWLFAAAPDYDSFDFGDSFKMLNHISPYGGNPDKVLLPRKDYVMNMSLITSSYNGSCLLRPLEGENILYSIGESIKPLACFDFGKKGVPLHFMINDGKPDFARYMPSDYFKSVLYVHDTERGYYFSVIGPGAVMHNYLFSSDYSRGVTWEDLPDTNTPSIVMTSTRDYYCVMVFTASQLLQMELGELSPLNRVIVQQIKNTDMKLNSNPLIAMISFKI